ncbi:polysaccharide lyase family 8 protein [Pholiota conissans]|uniref:Polysaccharide lyase family 8 protein n=1 Tax=Pholiota conissans TaxID=109636 RepID=A0A9P5Z5H2_9AGAR|nr:polysaccharide lyase family 8 protein [Pholiota conissans]
MSLTICALSLWALLAQIVWCIADDITIASQQRLSVIVGSTTGATSISAWLSTLGPDGKWPDSEINYTAGCDAQTASWPAQSHWSRISESFGIFAMENRYANEISIDTFAAAWHGGFKNAAQWTGNATLRASISSAMNFWFSNDFTVPACLDSGGTDICPCSTPGLWNTNWDSNIILIPGWVGQVCLLLGDSLTNDESTGCVRITGRAYGTFLTGINGVSDITGANTMDISSIGIDLGLSTRNTTLVTDAYNRIHEEFTVKDGIKVDGIRPDGSFGQHAGIVYNGNYGSANDIFDLELTAAGTIFQAPAASRSAFITLLQGDQWMIFRNMVTNVLHWDFSVLGRIISLPVADNQATSSIKTNLTQLQALGALWDSPELIGIFNDLSTNSSTANVGSLNGNRMFYANDYMVHRGDSYVTTLRMFSNRTQNTECLNSQNPFGFHLSDGAIYTYVTGNEYEDIFAAWDWNMIPGTTVDYAATPLTCSTARRTGTQSFVGGASDGSVGVAAMRYETPTTKTLNWRKTWFFLEDDVQFVMIARIASTTAAPIFTILDQRRQVGPVFINGAEASSGNFSSAISLWHGGVGYAFDTPINTSLSVSLTTSTGSWKTISTSSKPPVTANLFTAWLNHTDVASPSSYMVFPGTTQPAFQQKFAAVRLNPIRNDGSISALLDIDHNMAMVVFWETAGGSVAIPSATSSDVAPMTVKTNGGSILIVNLSTWSITVSNPTQTLTSVVITFTLGSGKIPAGWTSSAKSVSATVALPSGGVVGSSIQQSLFG